MKSSIVIVIIFAILTLIGMIIIGLYSRLAFKREKILDKFNSINNFLKERINLILRIIAIIEMPPHHEETLIMELEKIIKEIETEASINNSLTIIGKSNKILKKALALEKVYPELKNNTNYSLIRDEFENNQSKIMYAIEIYNEEVEKYNNYRENKLINLVSKLLRFKDYEKYTK